MMSTIRPPDLIIYLKASVPTLVNHISSRGRDYEGNMSLEYLKKLNQRYDHWIENFTESKVLVLPGDDLDFINNPEDLGKIINLVSTQSHGLF